MTEKSLAFLLFFVYSSVYRNKQGALMRYISEEETTELQKAGALLTEQEILTILKSSDYCEVNPDPCLVVRFIDERGNSLPRDFSYYISFKATQGHIIHMIW